ncbi:MAG: sigma 54-interacting transcriptional regulator [Planctomycetota bacterium]
MLFKDSDQPVARAISGVAACNPFSARRLSLEREATGDAPGAEAGELWSREALIAAEERPSLRRVNARCEELITHARERIASGAAASDEELRLYEDLVLYTLYSDHIADLDALIANAAESDAQTPEAPGWKRFRHACNEWLMPGGIALPSDRRPAHLYAVFFQIRRAFRAIFDRYVGRSRPAGALREAIWESVFTRDLRLYIDALYTTMGSFSTLITGESGTGKEIVAGAIGNARFIPFDPVRGRFTVPIGSGYVPVNLASLSPTLIESELFGHRKGAFTGATSDRVGYFEGSSAHGSVFLDEIGELDAGIQVKLLRLLQDRTLTRIGETRVRRFAGKVIAATNRDLHEAIGSGAFREDLYYRICSDTIRTPPLREQFRDRPDDLLAMVGFVAHTLVPANGALAERLAHESHAMILEQLGADYPWPGNFRELEQCVRGMLIRGRYTPNRPKGTALADLLSDTRCTADELLSAQCVAAYRRLGSYQGVARELGIDRRTVKARIGHAEEN